MQTCCEQSVYVKSNSSNKLTIAKNSLLWILWLIFIAMNFLQMERNSMKMFVITTLWENRSEDEFKTLAIGKKTVSESQHVSWYA